MPPVHRRQLPNGLTALVIEDHRLPIVCSTIWYRVGTRDEPKSQTGIAHFLEHMMFKGTRRFPKGRIDAISLRRGGNNNAFTSYDCTGYYFTFAADRWDVALDIEADRMQHLNLNPAEFEAERQVVLEELTMGDDHPWEFLRRNVRALAYSRHPYRHPIIGWPEDVAALTVDQMRAFHQRHYQPGNAVLVVAGDLKPADTFRRIEDRFGPIPGRPAPPAVIPPDGPPDGRIRFAATRPAHVSRLFIAFHAPSVHHRGTYAAHLLAYILGEGKTSRLYRRLVESDRTATSAAIHFEDMLDPALLGVAVQLKSGVAPAGVEAAVFEEIDRLHREGVTPVELARTRRQLTADTVFDQEDVSSLAINYGMYECIIGYRHYEQFLERARRVTAADIQAAARQILNPAACVIGCLEESPGASITTRTESSIEPLDLSDLRQGYRRAAAPPVVRGAAGWSGGGPAVRLPVIARQLANGLTVLICPLHHIPAVLLGGVVQVGSREDNPGAEGLAHFVAGMLDEGTPTHDYRYIAELVDGLGGTLETFSNRESSGLILKLLKTDFTTGLDLLAELLNESHFPPDRLELTRSQLLTHVAALDDRPDYVGSREFNRQVFAGTALAHPVHGTPDTIRSFTRAQLRRFHRRHYAPANTIILIAGDVDPARALREVKAHWHQRPAGLRRPRPPLQLARQTRRLERTVTVADKEQLHIFLGHLGIARSCPEFYPLLLLDIILGGGPGFTSRIPRKLRDEMGLAYTTYATITATAGIDPGRFLAYIATSPRHRNAAVRGILDEIRAVRERRVSRTELQAAKDYLTGSFVFNFENMGLIVNYMLTAWIHGLGFDYSERFPALIETVTAADIQAAARTHLDPEHVTIVEVRPKSRTGNPRVRGN